MNHVSEVAGLQHYPIARRGFMMSSLVSGFTLPTTVVEAQPIDTDTQGLVADEVQIPVTDGKLPGYFDHPAQGTSFPITPRRRTGRS